MGVYVAMYLAVHQPKFIKSICTLATKFLWNTEIAAREIKMLDADKIEAKLPVFATELQQRHTPENWKKVLSKTGDMLLKMGETNPLENEDLSAINIPVLLMLGDRGKMVSIEETMQVYKMLANA